MVTFSCPIPQGIKYVLFGVFDKSPGVPGGRTPGEAADTCIMTSQKSSTVSHFDKHTSSVLTVDGASRSILLLIKLTTSV